MKIILLILFLSFSGVMFSGNASADEKPVENSKVKENTDPLSQRGNTTKNTDKKPTLLSDAQRFAPIQRGGVDTQASLWAWPVTESGHFCYTPGKTPLLLRPSADNLEYLNIQTEQTEAVKLRWPAGETSLTWPESQLPLQDGRQFQLLLGAQAAILTVHRLPQLHKASEKGIWMAQQGCVAQARKLFDADDPEALF